MLVPEAEDVIAVKEALITPEEYRSKYLRLVAYRVRRKGQMLTPGGLLAQNPLDPLPVADGDSLLCACGVETARAGRCHRTWAASLLALAGWTVILDQEILSVEAARLWLSTP